MYFITFLRIFNKILNYDSCLLLFNYVQKAEYKDNLNYWENLKQKKNNLKLSEILKLISINCIFYCDKSLYNQDLKPYKNLCINNNWSYSFKKNKPFNKEVSKHLTFCLKNNIDKTTIIHDNRSSIVDLKKMIFFKKIFALKKNINYIYYYNYQNIYYYNYHTKPYLFYTKSIRINQTNLKQPTLKQKINLINLLININSIRFISNYCLSKNIIIDKDNIYYLD